MSVRVACLAVVVAILSAAPGHAQGPGGGPAEKKRKVVKTDEEWAKQLTRAQFLVTRRKATEPAFSGKYVHVKTKGAFACVCCGEELFSSKTKFESGTGWPSFYQPIARDRVDSEMDYSTAEPRVEVMCSACGAHLGHVFNDGPPPTGLRYCINSAALKLVPAASAAKAKAAPKKAEAGPKKPEAEAKDAEPKGEK